MQLNHIILDEVQSHKQKGRLWLIPRSKRSKHVYNTATISCFYFYQLGRKTNGKL